MPEATPYEQTMSVINSIDFKWTSLLIAVVTIIAMLVICNALGEAKRRFINKTERGRKSGTVTETSYHFLMTFVPAAESAARFIVIISGGCVCLSVFNISVSPIFYIISMLSVCVSFGAKDAVSDIIRGILTLVEGKIALGNFVSINGSFGRVKSLSIRQIEIQHDDGSIELFPFSKVGTIRNFSIDLSIASPTFQIPASISIEQIERFANETLAEMRQDDNFASYISEKTPMLLTAKVKNVTVDGIDLSFSIPLLPGNPTIFSSGFYKIMLKKLRNDGLM
jgi:small-conductance mechanosensitive channel